MIDCVHIVRALITRGGNVATKNSEVLGINTNLNLKTLGLIVNDSFTISVVVTKQHMFYK